MNCSRMVVRTILPVVLLFAAASWCEAQPAGRARRGFGRLQRTMDKPTLLRSEQVQKELKVTDEQKTKIGEIVTAYREEARGSFGSLRDLSDEEREEALAERQKKRTEALAKADKAIAALLKEEQMKRLNEIVLQQKGVAALTEADVVTALKLSEEQVTKIKGVISAQQEEQRKLFESLRGGGGGGREEMREKMATIRTKTETNALAVLSDAQKEQFKALKGAAFELDLQSLRRGRGGRGFGGGGGGGRRSGQGGGGGGERSRPPADD